jgi:hypothetical protein
MFYFLREVLGIEPITKEVFGTKNLRISGLSGSLCPKPGRFPASGQRRRFVRKIMLSLG